MPLVKAQCTNCGAALEVDDSKEAAICPYCNTPYIVEKAINNYTTNITNNIQAQTVNVITQKEDFEIIAGVLKNYTGRNSKIIIPDDVVEIASNAIPKAVTSVEFSENSKLTKIDNNAFFGCTHLTKIVIPNSTIEIGNQAFANCNSLESVVFSQNSKLTKIDSNAFFGCTHLIKIVIPNSTIEIGNWAFANCDSLESVVFSKNSKLLKIGCQSFLGCKSLVEIVVPICTKEIGDQAFAKCDNLKCAEFPAVKLMWETFMLCKSLQRVIIIPTSSETPQTHLMGTFYGCSALKYITIPEDVKMLGTAQTDIKNYKLDEYIFHGAFEECTSLEKVDIENDDDLVIIIESFINCKSLKEIKAKNPKKIRYFEFDDFEKHQYNDKRNYKYNRTSYSCLTEQIHSKFKIQTNLPDTIVFNGCYVATCVYGSYDCPQVWTLRRFRDDTLGSTWYGRAFIRIYYAISPTLVKWFGKTKWFKKLWRGKLDRMVKRLNGKGVKDTPYQDKQW